MDIIQVKIDFYQEELHIQLEYYRPDYVITGEQGAINIKQLGITNVQVAHLPFFDNKEIDLLGSFKVLFVKDSIVVAQLHLIE